MKIKIFKVLLGVLGGILPNSYQPFGKMAKKFRYFCAKNIVKQIGENVNVESGATFASDLIIGNNSGIGVNCKLDENITIGENVMMARECLFYTRNHTFDKDILEYRGHTKAEAIIVDDNVWIGARCIILPGVKIGKGATIGAGSIVTKNVPAYSVVGGNPAKVIKRLV